MFYKLKKNFLLRGWKMRPFGIVDTNTGETFFLPQNQYEVLRLSTGLLDSDGLFFSEHQRKLFQLLEENGLIEAYETQQPVIAEIQKYHTYDCRWIGHVHWSITGNCNFQCRHCYLSASNQLLKTDLSIKECKYLIDEMSVCGIFRVSLTGGEALLRPDFWEIVDTLLEKGIHITQIYSNGLLINENVLKECKARKIRPEFNISYDGIDGWHDWLRGRSDATFYAKRSFLLCKEYGFVTGAELCIHKGNAHTLRDSILQLANWGVCNLKVSSLVPTGTGRSLQSYCLTKEEVYELFLDYIPHYYEDQKPLDLMLGSLFYSSRNGQAFIPGCKSNTELDAKTYCICGHARNTMYLSNEGRALPCIALSFSDEWRVKFPKLQEMGLKTALTNSLWLDLINMKLDQYFIVHPECQACEYKWQCGAGCRAKAIDASLTSTYGYLQKDLDTCLMYRGGYYKRQKSLLETFQIKTL